VTPGRGCMRGPRNTSHEQGQSGDRIAGMHEDEFGFPSNALVVY